MLRIGNNKNYTIGGTKDGGKEWANHNEMKKKIMGITTATVIPVDLITRLTLSSQRSV